jgi:2-polyprenyl-6-hydroxyphenyl methylase/3-demethylubiquinone-9 3-methyltransferase
MSGAERNADPGEVARFNALASRWWDPAGEMRLLHQMNPVRLAYIGQRAALAGVRCVDVGCGAGILCEALAREGATVTGIDLAEDSLAVARLHLLESGLDRITYRAIAAEELAATEPGRYDVVTCMEMIEHVPDPASVVAACARLARPGGQVFVSTLNRTPRAYAVAILGAEYLLGLLPRGTHDFSRFIRPSELDAWARHAGLALADLAGLELQPGSGGFALGADVQVNYLAHFRREAP